MTRIRPARENDATLLPAIERSAAQSFRMAPGLNWVTNDEVLAKATHLRRIRRGTCWVAVDPHDSPIGFLSAEMVADRALHVHEMSVAEPFQRNGVGRALLNAAIEWAKAHHFSALTLTTFRDVPWNAPFYSRLGFEVLNPPRLDTRLTTRLRQEVEAGFAEGTRCAMRLFLDDQANSTQVKSC